MIEHVLELAGRRLKPIVQGGMGVGVSAHRLAGAVAAENAVGTVASVDLRHHHPDLLDATHRCRDPQKIAAANLTALDREIRAAKQQAAGQGMVAVNVMKAVAEHPNLVRQACESGVDAVVMGAGLPLDLPEMTADYPRVALIPILSDARGIALVVKKWLRKGRLPDAIVIEHPAHAGGHLGASRIDELRDGRFEFGRVLTEVRSFFAELALAKDAPKLIVAGGIDSHAKVQHWLNHGADAVQLGTAFAVTREGDAHPEFKRVLAEASPEQLVEFTSVAGLPARAVLTPWLRNYLKRESSLQAASKADPRRCTQRLDCLSQCGLRDGIARIGQFCIDLKLAAALRGEVDKGLFFRGASRLPFGQAIRPVRELLEYLMSGTMPADLATMESGCTGT
ncbi:NAD(P)H-dependent flavin oxidoreductase [Parachitinimonas caeni]|uniref:Nitronate monooxygenase family protein n=1 Tax=Parachitinimonas caeni TaxID=3031301 RepID=A0ABT7E2Q3_9NEIS|nr:nitronate monooxygenase family protein [Parachitinimonas caeni]MDK2125680.1 nitronate monooxygenase family protein [Parachitinimonas caeni]